MGKGCKRKLASDRSSNGSGIWSIFIACYVDPSFSDCRVGWDAKNLKRDFTHRSMSKGILIEGHWTRLIRIWNSSFFCWIPELHRDGKKRNILQAHLLLVLIWKLLRGRWHYLQALSLRASALFCQQYVIEIQTCVCFLSRLAATNPGYGVVHVAHTFFHEFRMWWSRVSDGLTNITVYQFWFPHAMWKPQIIHVHWSAFPKSEKDSIIDTGGVSLECCRKGIDVSRDILLRAEWERKRMKRGALRRRKEGVDRIRKCVGVGRGGTCRHCSSSAKCSDSKLEVP